MGRRLLLGFCGGAMMNKDLERFKKTGDRIHRHDRLKRITEWFLVFVGGVAFGYFWHLMAVSAK
jgi:hypothetical protein